MPRSTDRQRNAPKTRAAILDAAEQLFAANGYDGASHGCVNVRDRATVAWLFDRVRLGDKVIVYRS